MRFRSSLNIFSVLLMVLLVAMSCSRRPDDVLSRNKMEEVLTDLHKLDGVLLVKGFGYSGDRQNVYYYNQLLAKHGVTQAQFDSSLVYYTRKPKIFQKIYLNVIDNVTAFDQEVKDRKFHPIDSAALKRSTTDLWTADRTFDIKVDSMLAKAKFSIAPAVWWKDLFALKFRVRLLPNDSASGHHAVMRIHYADSFVDSVFTVLRPDSVLRRYQLVLRARHAFKIDSITGTLVSANKHTQPIKAIIDSVSLVRTFNALVQDSISNHIMQLQHIKDSIDNSATTDSVPTDVAPPAAELKLPTERRARSLK